MVKYEDIEKANNNLSYTDIKGKKYAEVNQRIKAFRMLHPMGCIHTDIVRFENGVCVIKATILDANGQQLGTGTAYEKEGSTFINKTSYVENCETSAVGRALGMVGIGIESAVSSYEEVSNAIVQQEEVKRKKIENSVISEVKVKALLARCSKENVDIGKILELYKVSSIADLTELKYANINENWNKLKNIDKEKE